LRRPFGFLPQRGMAATEGKAMHRGDHRDHSAARPQPKKKKRTAEIAEITEKTTSCKHFSAEFQEPAGE